MTIGTRNIKGEKYLAIKFSFVFVVYTFSKNFWRKKVRNQSTYLLWFLFDGNKFAPSWNSASIGSHDLKLFTFILLKSLKFTQKMQVCEGFLNVHFTSVIFSYLWKFGLFQNWE
jgi:hypothetical protein